MDVFEETKGEPKVGEVGYNADSICNVKFRLYGNNFILPIHRATNDPMHLFFEPFCIPECVEKGGNRRLYYRFYPFSGRKSRVTLVIHVRNQEETEQAVRDSLLSKGWDKADVRKLAISMAKIAAIHLGMPQNMYEGVTLESQKIDFDNLMEYFTIDFVLNEGVDKESFMRFLENTRLIANVIISQEVGRDIQSATEHISWKNIWESERITNLAGKGGVLYVRRDDVKDLLSKEVFSCTHRMYNEFESSHSPIGDKFSDIFLSHCKPVEGDFTPEQVQEIIAHAYKPEDVEPVIINRQKDYVHNKTASTEENKSGYKLSAGIPKIPIKVGLGKKSDHKVNTEEENIEDHATEGKMTISKDMDILEFNCMKMKKQVEAASYSIKGSSCEIKLVRTILPITPLCEDSVHIAMQKCDLCREVISSWKCCARCACKDWCRACMGTGKLEDQVEGTKKRCPRCKGRGQSTS